MLIPKGKMSMDFWPSRCRFSILWTFTAALAIAFLLATHQNAFGFWISRLTLIFAGYRTRGRVG
jgi:hypothetical protein